MVEEKAIVVDVKDELVMLEVVRRAPCSLCGQTRGCGISLWGKLFRHRSPIFRAMNKIDAKVGDYVVVGIEEQDLLKSSMLAYGIPLLGIFAGAGIASVMWPGSDANAVLGAGAGLAVGLLWMKGHAAGRGLQSGYRPVILRAAE
jgi:sigma-E factor negative regulatory protein RseC